MVNKAILIGNLGKDPELTYTASGVAVAKTSLATTERWTNRDGEKQESTEWHNLVFWRRAAEIANEYLRKGSRIYVEGRIRNRSYEDKEGQTRYISEIEVQNFQMLSPRSEGAGGGAPSSGGQRRPQPASGGGGGGGNRPANQPARPQQDGDTHYEPIGNDPGFSANDDDLPF